MAMSLRPAKDRGYFDHGWLKTYHSFSFGEYYDPKHMRHRVLRVINEDFIAGGAGFGKHGHRDMEIVTYVISGTLEHQDSLGNRGVIRAGEIQRMTAGTGIEHAETNPDAMAGCHLLQIWLLPSKAGIKPSWQQVEWRSQPLQQNGLRLLASPDERLASARIHQDTLLWHGDLDVGEVRELTVIEARGGWLQLVKGALKVGAETMLNEGDGLAVDGFERLKIESKAPAEFLWFDLP